MRHRWAVREPAAPSDLSWHLGVGARNLQSDSGTRHHCPPPPWACHLVPSHWLLCPKARPSHGKVGQKSNKINKIGKADIKYTHIDHQNCIIAILIKYIKELSKNKKHQSEKQPYFTGYCLPKCCFLKWESAILLQQCTSKHNLNSLFMEAGPWA